MQIIPQESNTIDLNNLPVSQPEPQPSPIENDESAKMDAIMQSVQDLASQIEKKKKDDTSALTKAMTMLADLFRKQVDDNDQIKQLLGQLVEKESTPEFDYGKNLKVTVTNPPKDITIPEVKIPKTVTISNPPLDRTDEIISSFRDIIQPLIDQNEIKIALMLEGKKDGEQEDKTESEPRSGVLAGKRKMPKLVPETPTGTIDGNNTKFYATRNPKFGTQAILFLNGQYQTPGSANDFTFSGNQITYNVAPQSGSTHYILFLQ